MALAREKLWDRCFDGVLAWAGFQPVGPPPQMFNDGLMAKDDANEHIPVGSPEIRFSVHSSHRT